MIGTHRGFSGGGDRGKLINSKRTIFTFKFLFFKGIVGEISSYSSCKDSNIQVTMVHLKMGGFLVMSIW